MADKRKKLKKIDQVWLTFTNISEFHYYFY